MIGYKAVLRTPDDILMSAVMWEHQSLGLVYAVGQDTTPRVGYCMVFNHLRDAMQFRRGFGDRVEIYRAEYDPAPFKPTLFLPSLEHPADIMEFWRILHQRNDGPERASRMFCRLPVPYGTRWATRVRLVKRSYPRAGRAS